LMVYSGLFMRWSLAIYPPNYALFACHVTNFAAQSIQMGRYTTADKTITEKVTDAVEEVAEKV
ncbi:hypothetical protein SARC_11733, partial [Sphaeroforma arctica JP610]